MSLQDKLIFVIAMFLLIYGSCMLYVALKYPSEKTNGSRRRNYNKNQQEKLED